MESENDKLKSTMREMVDDYTRQLELRDETIYTLEGKQSRVLEKEIGDLQHENIIVFKRIIFSIDHVFIEMEKLNGGTLDAFIEK